MKKAVLILVSTLFFLSTNAQTSEADLVKESFDIYKNAILNDKGKLAADYVDSRTMMYYSDILEKIKTADSSEIDGMGIIDKLTLLSIRHRTTKEDILSFNGRELFEYAIKSGMVGKNSVMNNTLGDISINGDFAKADLVVSGQQTPFSFHLYKEDNVWKVDLTSFFSVGAIGFKKVIEESGKTENEFMLNILELLTGKRPSTDIWEPLI